MSIGFRLPFARSSGSVGYFDMTNDEFSAVKENLRSLLLTNWGERPMHFKLGCNFIEFLFENEGANNDKKGAIADRVLSQVETWMPFVTIEKLNVIMADDDLNLPDHAFRIDIRFRLSHKPEQSDFMSLTVVP